MIGKIVGEKYQITEKLGTGGSSEVYKAYHIYLKTPWALKVVSSLKSLAENELTVLKSLNHHAFPRLVDVITDDSYNILVFDYYEGPTLQSLLQANGSIEVERVYKWALQILDALSYLHSHNPEPIIYRDLKPSNLIISKNDNIKLIDFGTARHFKHENTDDTVYLGTPGYAAPEQYGFGQTDVRTDIYNFGMTIIHLITGVHPLKYNDNQIELLLSDTDINKEFRSIILKCIAKDPDKRFSNVDEIKSKILSHSNQVVTSEKKKICRNAIEISCSGVQKGVGVTHFCMLFGMWLKNKGFRTAVIEYVENSDTKELCSLLNKELQLKKKGFYQIRGLNIYPAQGIEQIDRFNRSQYDYILIDYGVHDEYISALMPRSDVRLIMAPGADWKLNYIDIFTKKYAAIFKHPNTYLSFPMQDNKSIQIIKKYFKTLSILTIPYTVNPWKTDSLANKEIELIYEKLFQVKFSTNRRR
ncbi:MAG: serine/threonine protein kinase [Clostridiaceae bacterium]|jgi:serine/threonine-protein kinase|nr:serine/threonine protein kinase [Clostridiaceae bacterium]